MAFKLRTTNLHIFVIIVNILINLLQSQLNHEEIEYDDMSSSANWNLMGNYTMPSASPYCLASTYCLALYGDPPSDPQSQGIRNALSTEGYWDIYVEFDINTVGLTNGDSFL